MTAVAVAAVFRSIGGRGYGGVAEGAWRYERGLVASPVEREGRRGSRGRSKAGNIPANSPCQRPSHWRADLIFCIRIRPKRRRSRRWSHRDRNRWGRCRRCADRCPVGGTEQNDRRALGEAL